MIVFDFKFFLQGNKTDKYEDFNGFILNHLCPNTIDYLVRDDHECETPDSKSFFKSRDWNAKRKNNCNQFSLHVRGYPTNSTNFHYFKPFLLKIEVLNIFSPLKILSDLVEVSSAGLSASKRDLPGGEPSQTISNFFKKSRNEELNL